MPITAREQLRFSSVSGQLTDYGLRVCSSAVAQGACPWTSSPSRRAWRWSTAAAQTTLSQLTPVQSAPAASALRSLRQCAPRALARHTATSVRLTAPRTRALSLREPAEASTKALVTRFVGITACSLSQGLAKCTLHKQGNFASGNDSSVILERLCITRVVLED